MLVVVRLERSGMPLLAASLAKGIVVKGIAVCCAYVSRITVSLNIAISIVAIGLAVVSVVW